MLQGVPAPLELDVYCMMVSSALLMKYFLLPYCDADTPAAAAAAAAAAAHFCSARGAVGKTEAMKAIILFGVNQSGACATDAHVCSEGGWRRMGGSHAITTGGVGFCFETT